MKFKSIEKTTSYKDFLTYGKYDSEYGLCIYVDEHNNDTIHTHLEMDLNNNLFLVINYSQNDIVNDYKYEVLWDNIWEVLDYKFNFNYTVVSYEEFENKFFKYLEKRIEDTVESNSSWLYLKNNEAFVLLCAEPTILNYFVDLCKDGYESAKEDY